MYADRGRFGPSSSFLCFFFSFLSFFLSSWPSFAAAVEGASCLAGLLSAGRALSTRGLAAFTGGPRLCDAAGGLGTDLRSLSSKRSASSLKNLLARTAASLSYECV